MECPASLRSHVADLLRHRFEVGNPQCHELDLPLSFEDVADEILLLGLDTCHEQKEYRRWVANCGDMISKSFTLFPDIGLKVLQNEIKPLDVLNLWTKTQERNEKIFRDITSHHQTLIHQGWDYLSSTETTTVSYSIAALEMGKKAWVKDINAWMASQILKFFQQGGARKHYLKNHHGCGLSASDLKSNLFHDTQIQLLDIGSCYNYFYGCSDASQFSTLALDLCPAHESVYCGDFLAIQAGNIFLTEALTTIPRGNCDLRILELPSNYFDAITLSLVLSYLPSFREREAMIRKARLLLRHSTVTPHHKGLLVIAEKASIFQKLHTTSEVSSSPQEWIDAICHFGFTLVCYQSPVLSRHKVHLFVFCYAEQPLNSPNSISRLRIRKELCGEKKLDQVDNI